MRQTTSTVPEDPAALDEALGPRRERTDFETLAEKAISRREFLGRGAAFGAAAFVMGAAGPALLTARATTRRIGFEPVAANVLDTVTIPRGYGWHVVARWGDPMWSHSIVFD